MPPALRLLLLLSLPGVAGSAAAAEQAALPAGDSDAFRERMTEWQAPPLEPAPAPATAAPD
ncbi:MAG: hypothetical protein WA940_05650, partial [Sphingopyxis sp.]